MNGRSLSLRPKLSLRGSKGTDGPLGTRGRLALNRLSGIQGGNSPLVYPSQRLLLGASDSDAPSTEIHHGRGD
jgi:hypothetical protein